MPMARKIECDRGHSTLEGAKGRFTMTCATCHRRRHTGAGRKERQRASGKSRTLCWADFKGSGGNPDWDTYTPSELAKARGGLY